MVMSAGFVLVRRRLRVPSLLQESKRFVGGGGGAAAAATVAAAAAGFLLLVNHQAASPPSLLSNSSSSRQESSIILVPPNSNRLGIRREQEAEENKQPLSAVSSASSSSSTFTTSTVGSTSMTLAHHRQNDDDHHQQQQRPLRSFDMMNLKRDEALQVIQHIHKGEQKVDMTQFTQICQATVILLKEEPTLLEKTGLDTVTVVGDLHGSLPSLKKVLEIVGDLDDRSISRCIVFDGDFVDRGDDSIEVLLTLLLLKIAYPEQIVLLRGNHEDSMVAQVYGFADELLRKYNMGDNTEGKVALRTIWGPISDIFAALPMGVVTDTAFIVHGGLPSDNFRLDQLR